MGTLSEERFTGSKQYETERTGDGRWETKYQGIIASTINT